MRAATAALSRPCSVLGAECTRVGGYQAPAAEVGVGGRERCGSVGGRCLRRPVSSVKENDCVQAECMRVGEYQGPGCGGWGLEKRERFVSAAECLRGLVGYGSSRKRDFWGGAVCEGGGVECEGEREREGKVRVSAWGIRELESTATHYTVHASQPGDYTAPSADPHFARVCPQHAL